jgi:hypothetical protein
VDAQGSLGYGVIQPGDDLDGLGLELWEHNLMPRQVIVNNSPRIRSYAVASIPEEEGPRDGPDPRPGGLHEAAAPASF